jgi:hypothetical protein
MCISERETRAEFPAVFGDDDKTQPGIVEADRPPHNPTNDNTETRCDLRAIGVNMEAMMQSSERAVTTTERTATKIKEIQGWRGKAAKYRLSPPFAHRMEYDDDVKIFVEYVIVSASVATYSGPETFVFAAVEESDEPTSWGEMDGSFRGELNHARALRGLGEGYEITPMALAAVG